MLQIKTIRETDAADFDIEVNHALADGWTLTRRYTHLDDFVAEMERDVITDDEKCCDNCKYCERLSDTEPCCSCSDEGDKWEAQE